MFTFATPFFYIGLGSKIRDPGSEIRDEQILGSGSGIRDKTSQIRNTVRNYFFCPDPDPIFLWVLDPDLDPDPTWPAKSSGSDPKYSLFHNGNDFEAFFNGILNHPFQWKCKINVFLMYLYCNTGTYQIANFFYFTDPAKSFVSFRIRIHNTVWYTASEGGGTGMCWVTRIYLLHHNQCYGCGMFILDPDTKFFVIFYSGPCILHKKRVAFAK
jgi:hypothetical protein